MNIKSAQYISKLSASGGWVDKANKSVHLNKL